MNLIFFVPIPLDIKSVDFFSSPMCRERDRKRERNSRGIATGAWLVLVVFLN